MLSRGKSILGLFCFGGLVMRCVGDSTVPQDAGSDATTNDAAPDVSSSDAPSDVSPSDAGQDGDAASAGNHVYATNFSGALVVFDVPLTSTSQPVAVVTSNFVAPSDVEVVPGGAQIIVVDGTAKKLFIYNLPVTSASNAVIAIPIDFQAVDGQFDAEGNFWIVGVGNKVESYAPPFKNNSTVASSFTLPVNDAFGIAVNAVDDLVIGATGHLYIFPKPDGGVSSPTVDNTSVPNATGIVLGGTTQFVSDLNLGIVDMFSGNITSNKTPTAVGATVLAAPTRLKLNSNGNLLVADAMKGLVILNGPSYNASTVTVPNQGPDAAVNNFRGVVIGP